MDTPTCILETIDRGPLEELSIARKNTIHEQNMHMRARKGEKMHFLEHVP